MSHAKRLVLRKTEEIYSREGKRNTHELTKSPLLYVMELFVEREVKARYEKSTLFLTLLTACFQSVID